MKYGLMKCKVRKFLLFHMLDVCLKEANLSLVGFFDGSLLIYMSVPRTEETDSKCWLLVGHSFDPGKWDSFQKMMMSKKN